MDAAFAPLDPARRRLTLIAMCIGQGMILLDNTIVNVALPAIQRGLRVTPGNLEWTINAYVLALASLIVLGGSLGDLYGRKRLFLVGLAIFTLFSAACALSRSDAQLIVHRGLQGVGAAIMAPLSLSILVDAYPPEERGTAIGIWASVAGLGFGAGPIVGGLLIGLYDWPAVVWVNVPVGLRGFAPARLGPPLVCCARVPRCPRAVARPHRDRARFDRALRAHLRPHRDERARLAVGVHAVADRGGGRRAGGVPGARIADPAPHGAARP